MYWWKYVKPLCIMKLQQPTIPSNCEFWETCLRSRSKSVIITSRVCSPFRVLYDGNDEGCQLLLARCIAVKPCAANQQYCGCFPVSCYKDRTLVYFYKHVHLRVPWWSLNVSVITVVLAIPVQCYLSPPYVKSYFLGKIIKYNRYA